MKKDIWLCALLGLANASVLAPRKAQEITASDYSDPYEDEKYDPEYEPEYKDPKYDPKYEDPKYDPEYEPEYKDPKYDPEYEDPKYEPEYKDPEYEPEYKDPKYEPEYKDPKYEPEYKDPKYEPEYKDPKYDDKYGKKYDEDWKKPWKSWKPKTHKPDFFSLKVDEKCKPDEVSQRDELCPLDGYAIRLEDGKVIATPYNKWLDDKLPIFFVDDDTQAYTVSKKPLQLYVDTVDGGLKYSSVGKLPANSIATSFFKTGKNPLGKIDPSSAYFSWPTTQGRADYPLYGIWWFCPHGYTGQYEVVISDVNFGTSRPAGRWRNPGECFIKSLAAVNANPWKKGSYY